MDFIRQQITLIQERLGTLSATQKMLVAALVAITVMTMLYWGKVASGREMIALNSVPMSAEEIAAATSSLQNRGIPFTTSGTTIMVPAESQAAAMSDLSFNQALPTTPNFFESMFKNVSAWGTQGDYNARLNNAREQTLGAYIKGWPDVKSASVLIHDTQQRGIGRHEPRATVNIITKSGSGVKKLAQSATMLVLNAVSGLDRSKISVMVDGQSINNSSDGLAGVGSDAFDQIRQFEAATVEKIRSTYSFVPTIVVSVTADVDIQTKEEVVEKVDPTNKIILPTESTSESMTTTDAPMGGDPGAVPNMGIDANAAPAVTAGSSTEKSVDKNEVAFGKSTTKTLTPAGKPKCTGAAVRVPRSYFVGLWRVQNRKPDGDPNDLEYTATMQKEIASIRDEVMRLTNISDIAQVAVSDFPDFDVLAGTAGPGMAVAGGGSSGVTLLAGSYVKEAAIGVLALASLFMVSRIVKKSAPPAPIVTPASLGVGVMELGAASRSRGPSSIGGAEDIAGEVAESGNIMMGQELDESVIETAQMVEQVSTFVKDNPDSAATLVRRLMRAE